MQWVGKAGRQQTANSNDNNIIGVHKKSHEKLRASNIYPTVSLSLYKFLFYFQSTYQGQLNGTSTT